MTTQPDNSAGRSLLRDKNLQIIFAVTLIAVLGVASITPAFPVMIKQFHISGAEVGLLIAFFTLPGVFLAPVLGVLADRLGRRRILGPSLFLFALAGTGCFFAPNFATLLVLRVFQGIGGAALGSLNTTIIGDLYSGPKRAEAMGLNASVLAIGTASYPTIGGALAALGWNYPFLLPILALPVGIVALTSLRNPEPSNHQGVKEYLGSTWKYLKTIKVAGLFTAGVLTFIILYGAFLTYFTLLLNHKFGASTLVIGLEMSAMSVSTAIISSQLGRINRLFSLETSIKVAFVIYALGLVLIPFMPSLWWMLIPVVIFGLGHGINMPSLQTAVAGLAPLEYRAAFMSVNATMLRLGQTIGPSLMAIAYVLSGAEATFLTAAALAILVPIVAVLYSLARRGQSAA